MQQQDDEKTNSQVLKYYNSITPDIQQICHSFLKKTGLTCFIYLRIFEDGSRIYLSSHGKWTNHYIKSGFYKNHEHTLSYITNKNRAFALWDGFKSDQVFDDAYQHNIWNGFTIYSHEGGKHEACLFGTRPENHQIVNFYLNNIDLLQQFIQFFKIKAHAFTTPSNKNRLIVPDYLSSEPYVETLLQRCSEPEQYQHITSHLKTRLPAELSALSPRETDCLTWSAYGKTSEEIASILGISHHTVNEYLKASFKKLNANNKAMAVAKAMSYDLINTDELYTD